MYKKYGIRLPIDYFLENHLFDLINKVDTHKRVLKEDYVDKPENLEAGVMYMSSFKSIIFKSLNFIFNTETFFNEYDLVDIGCGKGKVLLVWNDFLRKNGLSNKIIGVDYSESLLSICKKNIGSRENIDLIKSDITQLPKKLFIGNKIFYLFNPFNEFILEKFLEDLYGQSYIIYNNPVHKNLFKKFGYDVLIEESGYHPNKDWIVFKK